jgi:hypothetical protein
MTRGTRYFMVGAVVLVVGALATGLVAYYNGGGILLGGSSQPREFAYMPANATAVAYADVKSIMASDFRQKLRKVLPTGTEQEKLKAEIGIDIEKDIDTVVAAFIGSDPTKGGGVVLVRGRFNDATIEGKAVQHGAVAETYKGKKLLVLRDQHMEAAAANAPRLASGGCVAFLEPGLLALGDAISVRGAIDTRAGGENISKDSDLMKLVNDLQGSGNAWVAGRFDQLSASNDIPSAVKDHLSAVQLFGASVRINGGVRGTVRAETRDDQSAEQLRDIVRGVLAAGKLMSGKDARADAVLNSFQLQGKGKTVALSFTVPPEVFDIMTGVAALKGLGK